MLTADEREELDWTVDALSRYRKALAWYNLIPAWVYGGFVGILTGLCVWVVVFVARFVVNAAGTTGGAQWWSAGAIVLPVAAGLLAAVGMVRGIARLRVITEEREKRRQELRAKEWEPAADS